MTESNCIPLDFSNIPTVTRGIKMVSEYNGKNKISLNESIYNHRLMWNMDVYTYKV